MLREPGSANLISIDPFDKLVSLETMHLGLGNSTIFVMRERDTCLHYTIFWSGENDASPLLHWNLTSIPEGWVMIFPRSLRYLTESDTLAAVMSYQVNPSSSCTGQSLLMSSSSECSSASQVSRVTAWETVSILLSYGGEGEWVEHSCLHSASRNPPAIRYERTAWRTTEGQQISFPCGFSSSYRELHHWRPLP